MVELLGIPGFASQKAEKMVTIVQQFNGAPRLFINGKPDAGMAMSHNGFYRPDRYKNSYEVFEKFADAGIHQFRALGLIEPWEDGTLDTAHFDEQMARLLRIDLQLLLMLHIILFPPDWYLFSRQISELSHIGAPIDVYYDEDIPKLAGEGKLGQYLTAVFMNALKISDEVRRSIKNDLADEERTILWLYGTDCVTPDGYSAQQMSDLIRMPVDMLQKPQPLKDVSHLTGTLIQYRLDKPLNPVFMGKTNAEGEIDNKDVEVPGWYLQPTYPAFLRRKLNTWSSVWSGAPELPAMILQQLVRDAGVHMYAETGDQVFVWNDMFALHAAFSGSRRISLPRPAEVRDALTGKVISRGEPEFLNEMQRGDTIIARMV